MEEKNEEYYGRKRSRSVAIIVRDGKILMEKVHFFERDFYTMPGGGIEEGETPEQAVLRELMEETGLLQAHGAGNDCDRCRICPFQDNVLRRLRKN